MLLRDRWDAGCQIALALWWSLCLAGPRRLRHQQPSQRRRRGK
jgi:hypothetical protein